MFWITWALKNLLLNRKRTLGTVAFMTAVLTIIFLSLTFLEGTETQMREAIQNNRGDLNARVRGSSNNMLPVYQELSQKYASLVEDNVLILYKNAQLIGELGYASGTMVGSQPAFLKYLNRNVSWLNGPPERLETGTVLIEATLAHKLGIHKGDCITVQIRTEEGMINTAQLQTMGVFVGSNLLYSDTVFMDIKDLTLLFMEENQVSEVRTYFRKEVRDDQVVAVLKELSKKFYKTALFDSPRLTVAGDSVFAIFRYYRYLTVFIFSAMTAAFIIVLYFAIQNAFFSNFRSRKQEISTLMTYGLRSSRIKVIVFWEALFLFMASLAGAVMVSVGATMFLRTCTIDNPNTADVIVAIGGPRLCFAMNLRNLAITVGLLLLMTVYSAHKGANMYLKMEIREIMTNS